MSAMTNVDGACDFSREATPVEALRSLVAHHIEDPDSSWSVGTFGAIAEFHRDPGEPVALVVDGDHVSASTARGAMSLSVIPGLRAVAYETAVGHDGRWGHGVAFCLPAERASGQRRHALTELGSDIHALRPVDREATLFDIGLGCRQVDVCVRSDIPQVRDAFRAQSGRPFFDADNPLMAELPRLSPHRVFLAPFARVEVYQPVPPPDGITPMGPHTHVLPGLVREARTHAATVPIPEGWVPCATLYPAHPAQDDEGHPRVFDRRAHDAFQDLLRQHGDPAAWALKRAVLDALDRDGVPIDPSTLSRHGRTVVRVALRQWVAMRPPSASWRRWHEVFDRDRGAADGG